MGIVYLADQISLSRKVTVKVLPSGRVLLEDILERFRREAEVLRFLGRHPGIVTFRDAGLEGGRC